ncbi:hypothetical protein CQ13_04360 [Bradyrhizobium retamae]|uniref:Uncharacterized protein n=1 Tax=Bradyrhizobium retamae TaxID=1300035 RepID=A0A0R3N555_9BRAD|nr:hypothetical protein CQ13_04360 [Bradyrhizobium retamae]
MGSAQRWLSPKAPEEPGAPAVQARAAQAPARVLAALVPAALVPAAQVAEEPVTAARVEPVLAVPPAEGGRPYQLTAPVVLPT